MRSTPKNDDKSFFESLLGFTSSWDYKPKNHYISIKIFIESTLEKIQIKSDCFDVTIIKGCASLYCLVSFWIKLQDMRHFVVLKRDLRKKIICFEYFKIFFEDDDEYEINFDGGAWTFISQKWKCRQTLRLILQFPAEMRFRVQSTLFGVRWRF